MEPAHRRELLRRWRENELTLRQLLELPVGDLDPAERERLILIDQEAIEYTLDHDTQDWSPASTD